MGRTTKKKATNSNLIKTFTYFIPEPAQRKSGYREKEFDKIMQGILSLGFEILEIKAQALSHGMFVLAVLKAKDRKIFNKDLNLEIHENFQLETSHSSPDIILDIEDE